MAMHCKTSLLPVAGIMALLSAGILVADETARILSVVDAIEEAWAGVDDYTMQVAKTERLVDGRETSQTVFLKFRRPDKYYFKVLDGSSAGAELIYPKNEEEPLAIAHPGGAMGKFARFLRSTVVFRSLVPTEFSLQDPSIVRGQHQTVLESNLGRTIDLIADNIRTAVAHREGEMRMGEDCSEDGHCAIRIDLELPAKAGLVHEVGESENLWTIAARYGLPMYVIWYNNPDMRDPVDVRVGQFVFIPRYYAAKGRIWISRDTGLLEKLEIFDREGRLYERYVYSDIRINIGLPEEAFEVDNPEYNF